MESGRPVVIKKKDVEHRYMQVYRQMKEQILSGVIRPNERLLSVRDMAEKVCVNAVTVVKAYDLLEKEGLVQKKRGSGTFVRPVSSLPLSVLSGDEEWQATESTFQRLARSVVITDETINFASATPSPDLFPVEPFKKAMLEVLDRDQGYAFGYQNPEGYDPLRQSVQELMKESGIHVKYDQILIVSGAQQGIDLVAKGLLYPGETAFVERPTYGGALQAFSSRNARLMDIPMNSDGLDMDYLERAVRHHMPRLIYVMPTFQNPTGISYSREKKKRLLELANTYDFLVLEDDYINELAYEETEAIALKSMDRFDRVIYIKSFSKMFMPGLRLGVLIVPELYMNRLLGAKQAADISTSGLLQRVLERYLASGDWIINRNQLYEEYHDRFRWMHIQLEKWMPAGVEWVKSSGGLTFWLSLPGELNTSLLYQSALDRKLIFAPGELFYLQNPEHRRIRLSVASVTKEKITEGVRMLAQLIRHRMKLDLTTSVQLSQYHDPVL